MWSKTDLNIFCRWVVHHFVSQSDLAKGNTTLTKTLGQFHSAQFDSTIFFFIAMPPLPKCEVATFVTLPQMDDGVISLVRSF